MLDVRESFISSLKAAVLWKTLNKISGLMKHIVIAAAIGLSIQLDIFYMAMALLGVFVFTWAQMLEVMAVPSLVKLYKYETKKPFLSMAGGLFILCVLFSFILGFILFIGRDYLSLAAWGFDEEKKELLSEAFTWFSPVLVFYIPIHFMGSVFRSIRRFKIYFQAEFIIGIVSLILIILYKNTPYVLMWSFSIGTVVAFLFLFVHFSRSFLVFANPFSKEIIQVLKIAPGLLALQSAHYFYILTDRIFISFLSNGSIGALVYGRTLAFFIENLVGIKNSFITIFSEADSLKKKNQVYNDLI